MVFVGYIQAEEKGEGNYQLLKHVKADDAGNSNSNIAVFVPIIFTDEEATTQEKRHWEFYLVAIANHPT